MITIPKKLIENLDIHQIGVLVHLVIITDGKAQGSLVQKHLAKALRVSPTTLRNHLEALERLGKITFKPEWRHTLFTLNNVQS